MYELNEKQKVKILSHEARDCNIVIQCESYKEVVDMYASLKQLLQGTNHLKYDDKNSKVKFENGRFIKVVDMNKYSNIVMENAQVWI